MIAFLLQAQPQVPPAQPASSWPAMLIPDAEHMGVVLVRLALTAIAAWVVQRLLFLLVRRGEQWMIGATRDSSYGTQRAHTVGQLLRNAVTAMVVSWACVHSLEILGWDVKPLLVGASILGAALGFGAQFLVRDIIAGTFIFIEDQFVVGDTIDVSGRVATVEAVTLRSTRLRDFEGREVHIPNGEMKVVMNLSRGWSRAVVDLTVAPGQDLARALHVAEAVAADLNAEPAWRGLMLEPFEVMGFESAGRDGALLRVATRALSGGDAARLSREFRLRLLQRWKSEGIRTALELALVRRGDGPAPAGADA